MVYIPEHCCVHSVTHTTVEHQLFQRDGLHVVSNAHLLLISVDHSQS